MKAKRLTWRRALTTEQLERRELLASDFCCHASEAPMGPPDDVDPAQVQEQTQTQEQTRTQLRTMLADPNEEPVREQTQNRRSGRSNAPLAQQQSQRQERPDQADDVRLQNREQVREQKREEKGEQGENEECEPLQERERERVRDRDGEHDGEPVRERKREHKEDDDGVIQDIPQVATALLTAAATAKAANVGSEFETVDDLDELKIRVAPNLLVLSAKGGNLTLHTNVSYNDYKGSDLEVALSLGTDITLSGDALDVYADDRGNLVVQIDGEVVKTAIDVAGVALSKRITTGTVALTIDLRAGAATTSSAATATTAIRFKA